MASVTTRSLEALQLYSRAVDDIALGRMQSAQSRLQAALTLDADFAMAHYRLAMVHRTLGQRKTEIEEIEHAYQLSQRVSERERYVLQAAHFDAQGHIDRATELLEILVNLYPDDADAYYELALAYDSLRKPQVAIADLQQVLRLKPYSAEGYAALMS